MGRVGLGVLMIKWRKDNCFANYYNVLGTSCAYKIPRTVVLKKLSIR
jgi:hypothetical protein